MAVSREEVRKVAGLAELAVDEADLDRLVEQFNAIVAYVAQLDAVPADPAVEAFSPGPVAVRWREDVPGAEPLALPPSALAPVYKDGFFVVPRLSSMESE